MQSAVPLGAAFCLVFNLSSAVALASGAFIALSLGNPWSARTQALTSRLLSISIIALGAGMNLMTVARTGAHGLAYTALGIACALGLGIGLGRLFRVESRTSALIAVGTAICGGSAIAAVAPVIRAKSHETSVALAIVFLLNAVALVVFPWLGHAMEMTQEQFGLWAALAIHDTSSVVGASLQYGPRALEIGVATKLARALWIVPVTFVAGLVAARFMAPGEVGSSRPKRPWFILGFLAAAALATWIPALAELGVQIEALGRRLLVMTLFLIGAGLTRQTLRAVGLRPFALGAMLWIVVAGVSLAASAWLGAVLAFL